jgi:hypothetical protein
MRAVPTGFWKALAPDGQEAPLPPRSPPYQVSVLHLRKRSAAPPLPDSSRSSTADLRARKSSLAYVSRGVGRATPFMREGVVHAARPPAPVRPPGARPASGVELPRTGREGGHHLELDAMETTLRGQRVASRAAATKALHPKDAEVGPGSGRAPCSGTAGSDPAYRRGDLAGVGLEVAVLVRVGEVEDEMLGDCSDWLPVGRVECRVALLGVGVHGPGSARIEAEAEVVVAWALKCRESISVKRPSTVRVPVSVTGIPSKHEKSVTVSEKGSSSWK